MLIRSLALLFTATSLALAQPTMEPGPRSPEDSLRCIKVRPEFTVELMAAEPLVQDPIAFAWGADGKFWVVEMGDYPLGVDGKNKPGGRVKFLTKSRDAGSYDKATLFLDNLSYPTGVTPWKKGVLITCAPDILYAEDTNGDGKADKLEVLFTGFGEGNQQHRVNGLVYGVDGLFYGANGDSGGKIKSLKTGKVVDIRGRDFRIDPERGILETQTGQTQFGRCCDDWGNWFGCNNTNPMYHFVLDDQMLSRNPHVFYPSPKANVSITPGAAPVFPVSKPLPRFNSPNASSNFTSACSVMIFRDRLLGDTVYGNSFVCEPVHNLIHREILSPRGSTFTSRRADDEKDCEFLASTDNWFRPVFLQTGPDGALWIADMYRYVIEHPQWIPKDWQQKLDLRAGHDKGRIYRVVPKNKAPRPIENLTLLDNKALVRRLASPNGWTRDTAQALLIERQATDTFAALKTLGTWRTPASEKSDPKEALDNLLRENGAILNKIMAGDKVEPFENDPAENTKALARLHALGTFDRLVHASKEYSLVRKGTEPSFIEFLLEYLTDPHPLVRAQGFRVWQRRFGDDQDDPDFDWAIRFLQRDSFDWNRKVPLNPQFRLHLAYALNRDDDGQAARALAHLLKSDVDNAFLQATVWSSLNAKNWPRFFEALTDDKDQVLAKSWTPALTRMAYAFKHAPTTLKLIHALSLARAPKEQLLSLAPLLEEIDLAVLATKEPKLTTSLSSLFDLARALVRAPKEPLGDRLQAVRLLGRQPGKQNDDMLTLASLLSPQTPDELQSAAIVRFGQIHAPSWLYTSLLERWPRLGPGQRAAVLDLFLATPAGTDALLGSMTVASYISNNKHKFVVPNDLDAARRQRLLQHKDPAIKSRAEKLLGAVQYRHRDKIVADYRPTLKMDGDATRGGKVFQRTCAACHQFGGLGQPVGPDLKSVGDKSAEALLVAIFNPNRAIEPRYVSYLATTKAGVSRVGLIASETSTTITLLTADGKQHDLLRAELEDFVATGKSLMPDGLEKDLSLQDVADLFAYLQRQWQTKDNAPRQSNLSLNAVRKSQRRTNGLETTIRVTHLDILRELPWN